MKMLLHFKLISNLFGIMPIYLIKKIQTFISLLGKWTCVLISYLENTLKIY